MNWDAIGAVAELVGALGVIASLLYLAGQVRAGTRASAVEAKLQSTGYLARFSELIIVNPELTELQLRGRADFHALSKEESIRFSNMALNAFWYFSAGYFQFRAGTLSEDDFYETRAVLHYWLRGRGCRVWWEKVGHEMMSPVFREFVEAEILEVEAIQRQTLT
jgi:hypothetical protein